MNVMICLGVAFVAAGVAFLDRCGTAHGTGLL